MNSHIDSRARCHILMGLVLLAILGTLLLPAIPQDPAYHRFADRATRFGIPNFWNVVSNLPFLAVGLLGIRELYRGTLAIVPELRAGYGLFFLGIALIGPGSAYYHAAPDNARLVWDRLPMTLAFMAFLAIVIAEHISVPAARKLLWPLIAAGLASIIYWRLSEARGHGDLRPYALIQFLPILLIPLILLMFRSSFTGSAYLWALLGAYGAAKLLELFDEPVFRWLNPVSGHTLKHVLAALGAYCFLLGLRRRSAIERREEPAT
jgi:hypothetical protein